MIDTHTESGELRGGLVRRNDLMLRRPCVDLLPESLPFLLHKRTIATLMLCGM